MIDINNPVDGEILTRYTQLEAIRKPYLDRARKYSKITVPYIMPEEGDTQSSEVQIDYASVGAEYVNHLSNTYLDEMFPVHRSYFKLKMPHIDKKQATEVTGRSEADIESSFAAAETEARWNFERKHTRASLLDHIKQLIITGNSCLYQRPDKEMSQNYAMDEYVIWRDQSGKLLEIITVDKKSLMSLDKALREAVIKVSDDIDDKTDLLKHQVRILTYIRRDADNNDTFLVNQAVEGKMLPGQQSYKEGLLPWIPTYWNRIRREVWGRGLVEDHYGSFYGMSILVEALVTAGAIATDFKWLVRPGSMLDIVEMNNSASGTYHYGNKDDVNPIELGKRSELDFVAGLVDGYRKQLGKIFLVLSSQMRDAERVTAEENRMRAAELNKAHGGVFGSLAITLQRPLAELSLRDMDILIGKTKIEPVVMTGLDAMGRASENEKFLYLFQDLSALASVPEAFLGRFKASDLLKILSIGRDVDTTVVKTDDEYNKEQQAALEQQQKLIAAQEMAGKATPEQLAEGIQQTQ